MNQIKKIQQLSERELELGVPTSASWHSDFRDSAYIFFGSMPFELTEGDILIIFSQYGVPVHMKLVRDKETGKSRGFGFLKYEDQRSTVLAVDNLNGAKVLGRSIKVDHCFYEEKDYDEEYERLLQEELQNDFADIAKVAKHANNTGARQDDEFKDPLLIMKEQEPHKRRRHSSRKTKPEDSRRTHQ